MILAYITAEGSPKTPSSIAAALDIPGERVKMAVQRLEKRFNSGERKKVTSSDNNLGTFLSVSLLPSSGSQYAEANSNGELNAPADSLTLRFEP